MDTPKIVMIAVAAILIGAAGGFYLGYAQRPEASPPRAETPADNAPAKDLPAQPAPETTKREAEPAAPVTPLKALIDQVAGEAAPAGEEGVIRGTVRLDSGEAVPGVNISATARFVDAVPASDAAFEDEVAAFIRQRRRERDAAGTATSGEDGTYELAGLALSATYVVTGELAGYRVDRVRANPFRVQPGVVIDFSARPVGVIEVVLKMPDGSTPQTGRVGWARVTGGRTGGGSSGGIWKAPVHRLELEAGTWRITGNAGQMDNDFSSEPVNVEVELGKPPQRIELQLKGKLIVSGFITSPPGVGPELMRVYLLHEPPTEMPDPPTKGASPATAWRHQGYGFRFENVRAGRNRVFITGPTGDMADFKDVEVRDGPIEVQLAMPAPRREDYIAVRVLKPDGSPAKDVEFDVSIVGKGSSSGGRPAPITQPDGSHWLARTSEKAVPERHRGSEWHYSIRVRVQGFPPQSIEYQRSDTHDVEIRLVEAANLTVLIPDVENHPSREKLRLQLVKRGARFDGHHPEVGQRAQALAGKRRFEDREPGEYEALLALQFDTFESVELVRKPVTLVAGENEITLPVPATHKLTITLPEGSKTEFVQVKKKGDTAPRGRMVREFKDGRSALEHVAEGEYIIFDNTGELEVRVPDQPEVLFNPTPYNALRMKVKAGGQVEALGFKDGDIITKLGELEIVDVRDAYGVLMAEMGKASTTWQVLRAGVATDVTFSGHELARIVKETGDNEFKPMPCYR